MVQEPFVDVHIRLICIIAYHRVYSLLALMGQSQSHNKDLADGSSLVVKLPPRNLTDGSDVKILLSGQVISFIPLEDLCRAEEVCFEWHKWIRHQPSSQFRHYEHTQRLMWGPDWSTKRTTLTKSEKAKDWKMEHLKEYRKLHTVSRSPGRVAAPVLSNVRPLNEKKLPPTHFQNVTPVREVSSPGFRTPKAKGKVQKGKVNRWIRMALGTSSEE